MIELTESSVSTYRNAIMLRRYIYCDYIKGKITIQQLYNAMISCDIIIMTNFFLLFRYYGIYQSR